MLTPVLGLLGALVYGSADFLGGLAAKRISAVRAAGLSALSGLVVLLVLLAVFGAHWSPSAVLWGALSGVAGAVALSLLYASLAIGPMSILSPLTAVVSAVVPLTWGVLHGERFAPLGWVGLGLALVAVVLVGFIPERGAVRPRPRGLVMGVGAGAFIGVFLILLDQTPDDSGLAPLVLNRAVNATIMFATVGVIWLASRRRRRLADATGAPRAAGWRPGLPLAIAGGAVDACANILLLVGLRIGNLSVMSVLTALYPAGTIILAAIVLKERIAPIQWIGLVLALAATGMLAAA
ncbi:EamA family transporter [Diaminobutyricibacter sp. McL0618]|uniref:EamA family transporter n=1 Tax=Leifsonia sp. McL0618 TaxID=3415677 RepID=UPI003CE90EC6